MKRVIGGPAGLARAIGSVLAAEPGIEVEIAPDHDWIEPVRFDLGTNQNGKRHRRQVRAGSKMAEVLFETRQQRRAKERAERKSDHKGGN